MAAPPARSSCAAPPRGEREHGLLFVAEAGRGGGARASLKKGPDGRASLPALFAQPRGSGGLPFDLLRLRLTPRLTRLRVLRTPFLPMVLGGIPWYARSIVVLYGTYYLLVP